MFFIKTMLLTVPTFFGTEAILAHYIRALGYETADVTDGKVTFEGDWEAVALANINLRVGERVLIQLAQFRAESFEELFDGVFNINWQDFIQADCAFPVKGSSLKSTLSSVPACTSIIKKAVVNKLSQSFGVSHFEETGPMMRIQFTLLKNVATIYLDTTGAPLYKRGYREKTVEAPMRETLAFCMMDITRWRGDRPFADPFCGSGTIPVEAALYAKNIAPGIRRSFASEKWRILDMPYFSLAREEARDNEKQDADVHIYASDIDPSAVCAARANAQKAGVSDCIHFRVCDAADAPLFRERGVIVCNPPYGERLSSARQCEKLYKMMGKKFSGYENAGKYILTSYEDFEKFYGAPASRKRKLYNGMLKCYLYQYFK